MAKTSYLYGKNAESYKLTLLGYANGSPPMMLYRDLSGTVF